MNPKPGELYKHTNGNIYEILYLANAAWDKEQTLIVYKLANASSGVIWVRSWHEFCDGRFKYGGIKVEETKNEGVVK